MTEILRRKEAHIDLCSTDDVEHGRHRGLFEDVALVHDAMPEISTDDLDLRTPFLDHVLDAPLMITGMTGGPARAGEINRGVAKACQALGIAFGVGSQRVMQEMKETASTFDVRPVAPNVVLIGNLGVAQARQLGPSAVKGLASRIDADYMAIHLNPAMELAQPDADADHDFRHGYDTIGRLVDALEGRIIVKECGTGIAPWVARRLTSLGVRAIDVSGSGGTSWVKVEAMRARAAAAGEPEYLGSDLGTLFADWGIPTAAAVAMVADVDAQIIASGGVDNGLTVAKSIALGADMAGMARPALQAWIKGGDEGLERFLSRVVAGLRFAMLVTSSRSPRDLRHARRVIGARLGAWLDQSSRFRR